jgi:hypothetical protein
LTVAKWKEEIRQRLASLNLAPTREAEIVEELAQHIEDRYEELWTYGASLREVLIVVPFGLLSLFVTIAVKAKGFHS